MKRYVIRRLLMAIPLLLAISFVCFVFINLIPSNPAEVALRVQQMPVITEEAVAEMEEMLGLNKPFLVRYFDWVLGCLRGDFGISYVNPARTVAGELARCLPATLQLAAASFVIVLVLSIPIGFLCAVYMGPVVRQAHAGACLCHHRHACLLGGAASHVAGQRQAGSAAHQWQRYLPSPDPPRLHRGLELYLHLYPAHPQQYAGEYEAGLCALRQCAGLPQQSIWVKHVLKNSMHTCIVAMGMSIPQMIAGTIVVENVFSWPGLGTLCISSIFNRDLPVIQAYVLFIGVLFVVFNLVFDILQTVSDPRLRREN